MRHIPGIISRKHAPNKRRLRPEIAIPVTAGLLAVAVGALVIKSVIDRKGAKANKVPKPQYIQGVFAPLDEVDRRLGDRQMWAIAEAPEGKRPRNQVLVVSANARDVGIDNSDPHGSVDSPALAISTDSLNWRFARLPEGLAASSDYDLQLVVGVLLDRQQATFACLGRLTDSGLFIGVPSQPMPSDQVMDKQLFAERYEAPIVRS